MANPTLAGAMLADERLSLSAVPKGTTGSCQYNIKGNGNAAVVSPVSQFVDKEGNFGFGYSDEKEVTIVHSSGRKILIPQKYPKLGTILQDKDSHYYVVWGKDNETSDTDLETVFVSKYDSSGREIATTGFVKGNLYAYYTGPGWLTRCPFSCGNCCATIAKGLLCLQSWSHDVHQWSSKQQCHCCQDVGHVSVL